MNRSMMLGGLVGGVAATALVAIAGFQYIDRSPQFAEVLDVQAVTQSYTTPRQECVDRQVTRVKPVQDQHQVAGTVVGAVVGGLLGSQIGGGSGKKLATVAGAAAGGYAGNKVQEDMQRNDTYTTVERDCRTVQDRHQKVIGYDVRYKLGDEVDVVRLDYQPGPTIPVKDGQLVLTKPAAAVSQ